MPGTSLSRSRYQRLFEHATHAPHWLELKDEEFEASYNKRPFVVEHRLADDPHFSLENLSRLARRVPRNKVLFRQGLTLDDALDRMEENQACVVIHNPECDAEYRPVIEGILGGSRGPARDVVLLNAGASLFIAGAAASVDEGILKASRAIDRGDAKRTLERLVSISTAEEFAAGASA